MALIMTNQFSILGFGFSILSFERGYFDSLKQYFISPNNDSCRNKILTIRHLICLNNCSYRISNYSY